MDTVVATTEVTVKTEKDVVFAQSQNWQGVQEDLKLDIFYPEQNKRFPLILFMHGGGFTVGDKEEFNPYCERLCKLGYVVANINYRVGYSNDPLEKDKGLVMAVYRATQDAQAAMRFLSHNAAGYHMNPETVFTSGVSAGAVTSLTDAYISQPEWDFIYPDFQPTLGSLQASGNTFTDKYTVRGAISMWGGLTDTTMISVAESRTIPVLLIQGDNDLTIPYEHAKGQNAIFSGMYGSYDIAQRFKSNGGCAELYFSNDAGHFYGFSQRYAANATDLFIKDVLSGSCKSMTVENKTELKNKPFSSYEE
jgi:acetyl esterase/lipase